MRQWYRIEAKVGQDAAEIYVYDEIGKSYWNDETVTAQKFIADLKALPDSVKTINVHVNSPGGSVFEATAIANALRAQRDEHGRTIEMHVEGLAASAATIITSAGSRIRIADNAMMMVHDPYSIEIGNASAMRAMADLLDRVRDTIIATYRWVSSKTVDELSAMMAATTWMNATEAVENGFATEIVSGAEVSAAFGPDVLNRLGDVPEPYRASVQALIAKPAPPAPAPVAASAVEVMRLCREAGVMDLAEDLVTAGATLDAVQAKVASAKADRAAADARASEITALCGAAKLPELAAGYIKGAMAVDDIRAHLTALTAKLDKAEIDGGLDPSQGARPKARIDVAAVYAARNGLAKH